MSSKARAVTVEELTRQMGEKEKQVPAYSYGDGDLGELEDRLSRAEEAIAGLADRLARVEEAVTDLDERLEEPLSREEVEGSLAAVAGTEPEDHAEGASRLDEMASRVSELETRLGQVPSKEELKGLVDGFADRVHGDLSRIASRVEELEGIPSRLDDLSSRLGVLEVQEQEPEPEPAPEPEPEPESEVGPRPSRPLTRMWIPARGGLPSITDLHRMFGKDASVAGKFIRRSKKTKVPTRAGLEYFEATGEIPPEFIEDDEEA